MTVQTVGGEFIYVSWHNDSDKPINWRIASHHQADALRRVLLSTAFAGCSFSVGRDLLLQLPSEFQQMICDAITDGAIRRDGESRWKYEGTVVLLADNGEQLASFDCSTEPKESRAQRYAALLNSVK